MKHFFTFLALFLGTLAASGQMPKTTVTFDNIVCDFGTIREQDGVLTHIFPYKNTGTRPLIITAINTSCGCTTPGYHKAPLMPGDIGVLTVKFDPTNQVGRVEKSIEIYANVVGGPVVLTIRGTVTPRPRTVEDDYPVELTDGVRITDMSINAGNVPNTHESVATLGFWNNSSRAAEIFFSNVDRLPSWLTLSSRKLTLAAGQRVVLSLVLSSEGDLWGLKQAPLAITVNGRAQYADVLVSAMFVEDFGALAKGAAVPRSRIDAMFYHFSTVKRGEVLQRGFTITNDGGADLLVRALDCDGGVQADIPTFRVAVGSAATLVVTLDAGSPGPKSGVVRVITNDPARPVLSIRILGNVVE